MTNVNDRRDGVSGGLAYKRPCRVATTANITLSGLQTIDTVTVVADDRVLVKDQTDPTENGIYVASTGDWERAKDFDGVFDVIDGSQVYVTEGTVNVDKEFVAYFDDDEVDFGNTEVTFVAKREQADEKYTAHSTSSLAIAVASKTFTVEAGKAFVAGQWVLALSDADNANNMYGQITSYSGTSLVVNVIAIGGSGTHADWTIVLSNAELTKGRQPPVGTGNVTGPGSATSGNLASLDATGKILSDSGVEGTKASQAEAEAGTATNRIMNPARTKDAVVALAQVSGLDILNGYLVATVGSNILTIALKTLAGTDPSASDPVRIAFRNVTLASGVGVVRSVTAALSLAISAGSTLGFASSETNTIYAGFIDNAGTVEIAASKDGALWNEDRQVSTTAEGGAGAADSASTLYSTTARSNIACRLAAIILIQTGSTPGNWANAPTRVTNLAANPYRPFKSTLKAWGNLTGITTTAFRDAFNASSLTDAGTGRTTITFATAMLDANYSAVFGQGRSLQTTAVTIYDHNTAPTASVLAIYSLDASSAVVDILFNTYQVAGN
jgi:hypothetical protein